jgi:hypothetical protein
MISSYHRGRINCIYDLHILKRHLWGGRFQVPEIEKGKVTGAKGKRPSRRKELICPGYGKFIGSVISV